eukprot:SAG31_NODE_399_length_16247_cov_19.137540_15_plen_80_part_00
MPIDTVVPTAGLIQLLLQKKNGVIDLVVLHTDTKFTIQDTKFLRRIQLSDQEIPLVLKRTKFILIFTWIYLEIYTWNCI